jgi:hypothetical protein
VPWRGVAWQVIETNRLGQEIASALRLRKRSAYCETTLAAAQTVLRMRQALQARNWDLLNAVLDEVRAWP